MAFPSRQKNWPKTISGRANDVGKEFNFAAIASHPRQSKGFLSFASELGACLPSRSPFILNFFPLSSRYSIRFLSLMRLATGKHSRANWLLCLTNEFFVFDFSPSYFYQ